MRAAKATHVGLELDSIPVEFVNELTSNIFKSLSNPPILRAKFSQP